MGLIALNEDSDSRSLGFLYDDSIVKLSDLDGEIGALSWSEALGKINHIQQTVEEYLTADHVQLKTIDQGDIDFHLPLSPPKIIRLEGCYKHDLSDEGYDPFIEADGLNEMDWPSHIAVPTSAIVQPGRRIELPRFARDVRAGTILAFVVGESTKYLSASEAMKAIAGVMVAGEVTLFDNIPGLFGYKWFDSSLPLGHEIAPLNNVSIDELRLSLSVNDDTVDENSTANWRFSPGELVASVSELVTLQPGDLILSGNPIRTDRVLKEGDEVVMSIDGVGSISSSVSRESIQAGIRL